MTSATTSNEHMAGDAVLQRHIPFFTGDRKTLGDCSCPWVHQQQFQVQRCHCPQDRRWWRRFLRLAPVAAGMGAAAATVRVSKTATLLTHEELASEGG
ncbi:Os08g0121566 [Oryza sativa Japonica Group]|uniref:Os08g0121566 protein n=1 Tax=Oryza sativa subsp. japonica TaxID=39947 RepID=A0A0P0XBG0_ORYSJ|nr:Os08g0121566 [Oryza sativa Japonica Group]